MRHLSFSTHVITILALAACLLSAPAAPDALGQTVTERIVVFRSGTEGHFAYRIPAIVRTADGTLLAFAEGRRDNLHDPGGGHINLVYKLSRDGGKSWSSLRYVDRSHEGWAASNPTAVVDQRTGRVFVFFNRWRPGKGASNSRVGTRDNEAYFRYSDDNGLSWSDPIDITTVARDVAHWHNVVFGPGSGIQASSGRLIVPAYGQRPRSHPIWRAAFALISDDGGKSWQRGEWLAVNCNENQMVELDNGHILVDARQEGGTPHRWLAESPDGGIHWQDPRPGLTVTPVCTGLLRYPTPKGAGSWYVWSGPRGPGRRDLILRVSTDQCRSFRGELLVGRGPAAYSNLVLLEHGAVGVLWEAGKSHPYETIAFTRVPAAAVVGLGRSQ